MRKINVFLTVLFVIIFIACAPKAAEEAEMLAADSIGEIVSSTAAVASSADSTRKFIRTADLRFKVKSVVKSTYDIEDITSRVGGFVTSSNLSSDVIFTETKDFSIDSSVIITRYVVTNSIVLRVPTAKLDTTLKQIARNIVYLDSRVITANDVALQLLSNQLTINRTRSTESRLKNAIDNRGKKLTETTSAEELLLNKQERSDNARIENLSLNDQISFSTISINMYQNEGVNYEKVASAKSMQQYEPGFGYQIIDALSDGWSVFKIVVVFLLNLWGIALLIVIAVIAYKFYKKKFGNKKSE